MQKDLKFTYAAWDCSKPVIAMINGFCLAGALEFAQCCDLRYCSEDSSFGVVETRFSNGIATMMMPWILGNRCRELIYTGDRFGAAEAHRLGLVDRVFPKATLEAETIKIAKRMSRVALDCLKWNKRAINQTFETMGLRAAIQYGSEACAIMDATGSPEAAEFDRIRRADGLGAALRWRDGQFAQFE
jgi:enoyl-CoA hydratase